MFITILYMFRATPCSSSGELIVSIQHLVYVSLCRWLSSMHVRHFLPDMHIRTVRLTYTRCCIDTINSPDDEHGVGINIKEKRIVRQVGYLLELYGDALSTEHKTLLPLLLPNVSLLLHFYWHFKMFNFHFFKCCFKTRTALLYKDGNLALVGVLFVLWSDNPVLKPVCWVGFRRFADPPISELFSFLFLLQFLQMALLSASLRSHLLRCHFRTAIHASRKL
jgi:hypothetical protein